MMCRKLKIWFLIAPLFFLSTKCDTGNNFILHVYVDLHLNIISELGNPALYSYTLIDGGVNGLIIYREDFDLFHVYDRTCSQYPEHNEAVEPDEDLNGVFICPECKSKFLLLTDTADPLEGPATYGLYKYYSVVEGDLLHVYN